MSVENKLGVRMISRRSFVLIGVGVTTTRVRKARAQKFADEVKSDSIKESDIEQRRKLNEMARQKTPSRQEVIEELREDRRTLQKAKSKGIEIGDSEIDEVCARMTERMHMTPQQLNDSLAKSGIDVGSFREKIRVDLTRRALRPNP